MCLENQLTRNEDPLNVLVVVQEWRIESEVPTKIISTLIIYSQTFILKKANYFARIQRAAKSDVDIVVEEARIIAH